MKTAIVGMAFLGALAAIGARFECAFVPYMVFGTICTVTVLVTLGKIKLSEYPIYIFGMSLALLWQTSMMGSYIVGADIHGELFMANRAVAQGWDWSYANVNNVSIILGGFAPLLAKIGIHPIWQFKALYPAIFACVPLILYFAYRKMMGEKRAYFAVLFFMIVPMFFVEIVGIVKSMAAEVFLALMVLFMVVDIKNWQKAIGVGLSALLATLCHYTIGTLAILYLAGSLAVLLATRPMHFGWLKDRRMPLLHLSLVFICVLLAGAIWLNILGQGTIWNSHKRIVTGFSAATVSALVSFLPSTTEPPLNEMPDEPAVVTPDKPAVVTPDEPAVVTPDEPAKETPSEPSYLYSQEPLVRTAIGLDFGEASLGGKSFRIVQYLTQLLLVLGFVYLLFRYWHYRFTAEFMSCVLASYGLLVVCVFLPGFSSLINASRFYQVSLFFLAPMLVVGVEELSGDLSRGVIWLKRRQ